MAELDRLPAPANRHARSLLRFPDERTDWVITLIATLDEPADPAVVTERLRAVHERAPIVGARLVDEVWHPGDIPAVTVVDGDPLGHEGFDAAFDLRSEAPLRVILGSGGTRLAIPAHHAALDGRAVTAIIGALIGGPVPSPVDSPPPGEPGSKLDLIRRFLRSADRVSPNVGVWPGDTYDTTTVQVTGPGITGQIAAACAAAARAHNLRLGHRLDRIGITIAVGGPEGVGNVASYRRIDLPTDGPIADRVTAAIREDTEPGEQVSAPRWLMRALRPVVDRFSDSILVSNLGRVDLPGAHRLEVFPVARGRSAVCFASATVAGGETSLTIRTRDLSPGATRRLLLDAAARL